MIFNRIEMSLYSKFVVSALALMARFVPTTNTIECEC